MFCFRDVLGTVCITSPFNMSQLSPLLPAETVDRLELDCLNSVRVRNAADPSSIPVGGLLVVDVHAPTSVFSACHVEDCCREEKPLLTCSQ